MREVLREFVNEGDLGFLKGDWSKMREPPPKWGCVGTYRGMLFTIICFTDSIFKKNS